MPLSRSIIGFGITALCLALLGCQQGQTRQTYLINAQSPDGSSTPPEQSVQVETTCSKLLVALQKLENAPSVDVVIPQGGAVAPMSFRSDLREKRQRLERKAEAMGCYSSRPVGPVSADEEASEDLLPTKRQHLNFDQCFSKCRELTERTPEQCFDACR